MIDYKKKETERCERVIKSYQEDIDVLQKDMDEVYEKYRKLAEKEAEDTLFVINYYKDEQKKWQDKLSALTPDGTAEKQETISEPEEVVVDTETKEDTNDLPFDDPTETVSEPEASAEETPTAEENAEVAADNEDGWGDFAKDW